MRILITGGAGFIGSNVIRFLLKKYPGYEIINVDRLAYSGNLENLRDLSQLPMYHFVQGDICNEVEVDALMSQGIDAVIHLASEPYPNPEESDRSRFIRTDVYGTYVLCEAAAAYHVDRFLHVSTAGGYGRPMAEGQQLRPAFEGDELRPETAHVASRIGADRLAYAYITSHQLPVTIVRPTAVFGPYQYPDQLMAQWVTNAILREPIYLQDGGRLEHDWLHVADLCAALDILLHGRKRQVAAQVFNVGSGHVRSEVEVAELLLHFLDRPRELVQVSAETGQSDQPVDTSKLEALGWSPTMDFHRGLSEVITWYQDHPEWWERLRQPGQRELPSSMVSESEEYS